MTTARTPNETGSTPIDDPRVWRAFAVASASIFMFVLDSGLLTVALPEIERDFPESSRAAVSWVSTGYLLSVASLILVAGRLGDIHGRRRIFRIGLPVWAAGSLLTGIAPSIGVLIAARFVQGVGSALVTSVALTMVLPGIPEARRPYAVGIWGTAGALAAIVGPTLGAELMDATSWRWALASVAPITLITYLAGRRLLVETKDESANPVVDPASVILVMLGIGLVALGLSQSRVWGWGDPRTLASCLVGAVACAAFYVRSDRHSNPIIDISTFSIPSYGRAALSAALQQVGFFSWFFSTSFVLREIWGWSVRDTGQALSISFAFSAITGWLGGRAAERFGYFWPTTAGALAAVAGPLYWVFAFDAEPSFWLVYLPGAALFGLGGGACGSLPTGIALSDISDAKQGTAYAAYQTTRRIASTMGLALMAALLGEASGDALLGGARNVWMLCVVVHLLMIVPLLPFRTVTPDRPT